jgi:large subunit ribosomal protein L17
MRHLKTGRKLGRNSAHRQAMFRNMVTSLILHGRVRTTDAKAKELRRYADRMITLGKQQTIAARRRARRFVRTDAALARLFNDLAPLFAQRAGGYTRITKVAHRRGDAAPLSIVELTEQLAAPAAGDSKDGKSEPAKSKATNTKAKRTKAAADPADAKSKPADKASKGKKK